MLKKKKNIHHETPKSEKKEKKESQLTHRRVGRWGKKNNNLTGGRSATVSSLDASTQTSRDLSVCLGSAWQTACFNNLLGSWTCRIMFRVRLERWVNPYIFKKKNNSKINLSSASFSHPGLHFFSILWEGNKSTMLVFFFGKTGDGVRGQEVQSLHHMHILERTPDHSKESWQKHRSLVN